MLDAGEHLLIDLLKDSELAPGGALEDSKIGLQREELEEGRKSLLKNWSNFLQNEGMGEWLAVASEDELVPRFFGESQQAVWKAWFALVTGLQGVLEAPNVRLPVLLAFGDAIRQAVTGLIDNQDLQVEPLVADWGDLIPSLMEMVLDVSLMSP